MLFGVMAVLAMAAAFAACDKVGDGEGGSITAAIAVEGALIGRIITENRFLK